MNSSLNKKQTKIYPDKLNVSFTLSLAFFLICLLVITLSNGFLVFFANQTQQATITRDLNNISEDASEVINHYFEDKFVVLHNALQVSNLSKESVDSQEKILTNLLELQPDFQQLLLIDSDRERIELHISELPSIQGDPTLIRQVWDNLIGNAIKFSSKKERSIIEIGSQTDKKEITFFIRDNGAGFDMRYASKLFGVFQRLHTEKEFKGTGVGLAIIYRVIHQHGGRVWVESEVDNGATFYFSLPQKEVQP